MDARVISPVDRHDGARRIGPARPRWWAIAAAALLLVLGVKLLLIGRVGSPAPFWDEWDGEGANLIAPYVQGTLRGAALFAPHNEHRIFFTRLLTLALLEVNGGWDPISEMIAGAFVHVAALGAIAWLLRHAGFARAPWLLAIVLLLGFTFPFSIENTLSGFQSQFYFLLLLSAVGVLLVVSRPGLSATWSVGAAMTAAAVLAMASGLLAPLAALVVSGLQMVLRSRPASAREAAGLLVLAAVLAVEAVALPAAAGNQAYRASGVPMFLSAFVQTAGWPFEGGLLSPLLLNAPVLAVGVSVLRERPSFRAPSWRLVALFVWVGGQCTATAYMRAAEPVVSRYLDIFSVLLLVNVAALATLAARGWTAERARASRLPVLGSLWFAAMALSLLARGREATWVAFPLFIGAEPADREASLATFMATGDLRVFDVPLHHSPYPDARRLAAILARPAIRGALPARFGAGDAERSAVRERLWLHGGLRTTGATTAKFARALGAAALVAGIAVLVFEIALGQLRLAKADRREGAGEPAR